jgi:alpha-glucosidase
MIEILKYWLEQGADGFRIDAINHLFEVEELFNEDYINPQGDKTSYDNLKHTNTMNRPESYEFIYDVREMMDKYVASTDDKVTRLMMTEAYAPITEQVKWYGSSEERLGAHFPFNFALITSVNDTSNAEAFATAIDEWVRIGNLFWKFWNQFLAIDFSYWPCRFMESPTG